MKTVQCSLHSKSATSSSSIIIAPGVCAFLSIRPTVSKMRTRTCFDDVAWERSEAVQDAWVHELFEEETLMAIGRFILKHRGGVPVELCDPNAGAFNVSFRMKFEDGGSAIIRFPKPGATMFPDEKVRNEVDTMRYIHQHTTIPVPFILHWGTREENPLGLGPFIIMEYIEHAMDLSDILNTPGFAIKDRPILDPNVDSSKLEHLYGQFADILLQLSTLRLPGIGSLAQIDDFTWEVARRPLSYNANELVRVGTLPRSKLTKANETFQSASSYFITLANLHLEHLIHQRNDAIESADDCRRRYIARLLFRKLAKEGRLTTSSTNLGPFSIWCDDLRPSNVLINEHLQIVGLWTGNSLMLHQSNSLTPHRGGCSLSNQSIGRMGWKRGWRCMSHAFIRS